MENFEKIMSELGKARDITTKVSNGINKGYEIAEHASKASEYYKSDQRKRDMIEVGKYREKETRLLRIMVVVWFVMIVGTVVLCIVDNDVILGLLHL